ncbi:dumpy isoform F [Danaus plexippus plexippus]|uniref:Dumpy isoform F n=1 Tax=Danaus plexippus plexippus TaxID=278856 RepID=A0A212EMX6_DANPL|nr:dumpy isoform F [Danaus plexippus plexippus]
MNIANVKGITDTARVSRRFQKSNRSFENANKTENVATNSRSQVSRRREESIVRNKPNENVSRTRSRSKPSEVSSTNTPQLPTEAMEQFDSRKSNNRLRSRRPIIDEANFDTTLNRDKSKSRLRQTSRYTTAQTAQPTLISETVTTYSEPSVRTTTKVTNYDDTSRQTKETTNNQLRRRSSTLRPIEITTPSRIRGRINTRTDTRPLDLEVSGTANALISAPKDPLSGENRNSRKLRYRTRQSETDTNLTGEDVSSDGRERKSSQTRAYFTSQSVSKNILSTSTENIVEKSRNENTARATKVVKRPVSRRKTNNALKIEKRKLSDEVTDDDNYPETFKALIQAKNASTHTSSPPSESLSVKASQKVFQTLTTTPKSFLTTPEVEKPTSLRSKLNAEDDKNNTESDIVVSVKPIATTTENSKPPEYRLRGTYTPRNKIVNNSFPPVIPSSTVAASTQRPYKFSRKAKAVTTEGPSEDNTVKTKRIETNVFHKKPIIRSSFYPKRNFTRKNNISSEVPKVTITERSNGVRTFHSFKARQVLPRTSYYSRSRTSTENVASTKEAEVKDDNEVLFADKKIENTADSPLIYTSKSVPYNDTNNPNILTGKNVSNKLQKPFIIKVNSKESIENSTDNEIINILEEDNKPAASIDSTTQKYHATYNDPVNENKEKGATSSQPPIRNILTRKFSRKAVKQNEEPSTVNPKNRDRNLRKYSDTFSKTTEASSNGIIADSDKPKHKFSSKYRASYLDKPFYKPTVPTITTSTVEGEDILLGLDLNEISFTKTRSPLTSADLKLSESLAKPLQVMNVEASHHSPSVTVSIFDALAEILTSTPRPRISSTTEVTNNQNTNSDVKQTFDAVSNNNNVNSVRDLSSPDTIMTKDNINTVQTVQITELTTPIVSNSMPPGGSFTPSLNGEDKKNIIVTTSSIFPSTSPIPPPTTPLSARKPFAIKILYAETESPRYKMTSESTLPKATTDNPKMVHNTMLFNNKIVSSELTSMLSNNIKKIIQDMDDGSKGRLSVEMAKLLKSLIPKLYEKSISSNIDIDTSPNTTPYSLEDIKDTENIVVGGDEVLNISSRNLFQNVDNTIVNSTVENLPVNNTFSLEEIGSTASTLGDQTTLTNSEFITTTEGFTSVSEPFTEAPSVDVLVNNDNSVEFNEKDFTNNNTPVPFLTNFELNDFKTVDDFGLASVQNMTSNIPEPILKPTSKPNSSIQISELEGIDNIEDPSQLSRLQLWILSKKARVLKMIEDLIRNHNEEIANAPLTELINDSNENLVFSNRLNEIVNTMTTTIRNFDISDEQGMTSTTVTILPETTTPTIPSPISVQGTNLITTESSVTETSVADLTVTTTMSNSPFINMDTTEKFNPTTSTDESVYSTVASSNKDFTTLKDNETVTINADIVEMTTSSGLEETTLVPIQTTDSNMITQILLDSTIAASTETNRVPQNKDERIISNVKNELNVATTPVIPKKDYVIFGILPNNTVVRKDPNDNVLESLTEASPYIIYGVLPNNTIIRKFPNGTRVPRIMPKIDILPISPWSLRNPYSPIHNIPAIVRPQSNPFRVSTNTMTSTETSNNGSENRLTNDTMSSSALNIKDSSSLGISTTNMPPAEKSTASHVLSLRTTTMLPSIDEILLNSISSAIKEEMVLSSMTSSTSEPRILTLDIDPETKQIRTEKPSDGSGNTVFKFIPIDQVTVSDEESNVLKLATSKMPNSLISDIQISTTSSVTESSTQTQISTVTQISNTNPSTLTTSNLETASSNQNEAELLQSLLREIGRSPKNLNSFGISNQQIQSFSQANNVMAKKIETTTLRSIEDDIRQFEEDTKLLKALLQATGRNPAELNLPSLDNIRQIVGGTTTTLVPTTDRITTTTQTITTTQSTTTRQPTTTMQPTTTTLSTTTTQPTTARPTTTTIISTTNTIQPTTKNSLNEDIRKLQEDTQLLQALLQATRNNNVKLPIISGVTSNVRVASNPFTTSIESNPTTNNARPVYTTKPLPIITTLMPGTVTVSTLQPQQQSGEEFGISTTFRPFNERSTTTTRAIGDISTTSRSAKSSQFMLTTEIPSTSTFSDAEDLAFLQNLKSVLSTKTGDVDPETALANRVIALAVEKSLNEIQTGKITTTMKPTTTTRATTTMRRTTARTLPNTPSIEDDIKQFEQDTKLLQALLKATGQDPSKLNLPTLPPTSRPLGATDSTKSENPTTVKPYGAKIAVKDELKNEQDDAKLLQTLIKLQDAQETTTQRSKIALTGQSSDEALKKLLQQAQPAGMLSEATKSSVSLSTEYGNSNDALLAALLKEQGFGPTTASSLDEQLRLAALLNQVVVTPKARRTTTPPPPPSPRRPILDGLAWLWQQWRETGPGPEGATRPNRRPAPSERPASSGDTSSRVNWFGSGPFVGNADEKPTSNRIPLEPPSVVTTEQGPGRGQLVSAAINVTRAFSQFLGAAIQGAAQTVQSVFRYGQRAATDNYTNGSG